MRLHKILSSLKELTVRFGSLNNLLSFVLPITLMQVIAIITVGSAINLFTVIGTYDTRSIFVDEAQNCVISKIKSPTVKVIQDRDCKMTAERMVRLYESGAVERLDEALDASYNSVSDIVLLKIDNLKMIEDAKWDFIIKSKELAHNDIIESAPNEEKAAKREKRDDLMSVLNDIKATSSQALDQLQTTYLLLSFPFMLVLWVFMSIFGLIIRRTPKSE